MDYVDYHQPMSDYDDDDSDTVRDPEEEDDEENEVEMIYGPPAGRTGARRNNGQAQSYSGLPFRTQLGRVARQPTLSSGPYAFEEFKQNERTRNNSRGGVYTERSESDSRAPRQTAGFGAALA